MLTILFFVMLVMMIGDTLLHLNPFGVPRIYWVLFDPLVHGTLALVVISPLFFHQDMAGQTRWLLIAVAAAILIDIDHFIAAGSFSINDAIHLSGRPAAHSLLFAVSCALIIRLLSDNPIAGWLLFIALLSHILRDASVGGGGIPFFWPLTINFQLSMPAYYATQMSLCLLAAIIGGWPKLPLWSDGLWQTGLRILGYPIS